MKRIDLRVLIPAVALAILLVVYFSSHPRGFSTRVLTIWSNQSVLLVFAAFAQFFVVMVRGIDLSVGAMVALSNVVASYVLAGEGISLVFGTFAVLATGLACGVINGLVVTLGRIPPIIATLATGAVFSGVALALRPTPGGAVNEGLSDALSYAVGPVPTSLILILLAGVVFSLIMRRTAWGIEAQGVGSSEHSAALTGISLVRVRIIAHGLGGLCAALCGYYLAMVTLTGDAGVGPTYTLNSIAAIVLGGVSLAGGVGKAWGVVIGALLLKTVAAVMFFSGLPPLAQPFFEGFVLAAAVVLGSLGLVRVRNRLKLFSQ